MLLILVQQKIVGCQIPLDQKSLNKHRPSLFKPPSMPPFTLMIHLVDHLDHKRG